MDVADVGVMVSTLPAKSTVVFSDSKMQVILFQQCQSFHNCALTCSIVYQIQLIYLLKAWTL